MADGSTVRILGIAGSLREKSFNKYLLRTAVANAPEGMTIDTFDIAPIPLYNDDVREAGYPEPVLQFVKAIEAADGILIVTPEYNHSVPGVLKNALDWVSRAPVTPLAGKPVSMMGASLGQLGTVRSQAHLRQVLACLNMFALNKPEVFVGGAPGKFDEDGRLTDEAALGFVKTHLEALRDWTLRVSRG
jgi:chromate reductase